MRLAGSLVSFLAVILTAFSSFGAARAPLAQKASECEVPMAVLGLPWSDPPKTETKPISERFLSRLDKNGVVIITAGGSSLSTLFPLSGKSAKIYFRQSPRSVGELVQMICDAAEPALRAQALKGVFEGGRSPILLLPSPGLPIGNKSILLPSNYGPELGEKVFDLALLIREELTKRSEKIGIPGKQLSRMTVYVENDALPIVANAAYKKLKAGESATVFFVGTGTGSSKVEMTGAKSFRMLVSEESHARLGEYPEILGLVPKQLVMSSAIANAERTALSPENLTLENISGGGRVTNSGNRTHLGGANSVALAFLLPENERPAWVRERSPANAADTQKIFWQAFGLRGESELEGLLANSAADRELLKALNSKGSVSGKDVDEAYRKGSRLAETLVRDNVFAQGLVAGVILLNVGKTPSGNFLSAARLFGTPGEPNLHLKLIVRATEGLFEWGKGNFEIALRGINAAKGALFNDPAYVQKLRAEGFTIRPESVVVSVERVFSEPDLHPDFGGLDRFSDQLREHVGD